MYISDETIDKFIKEDVPYIDLTTFGLGISGQKGSIKFFTREDALLCGTEEAARIFQKLNIDLVSMRPSGSEIKSGDTFLEGMGNAEALHAAWKPCQNIIDYYSGVATRTRKLVNKVSSVNPKVGVLTTRKIIPGTKELSVKAAVIGGAFPHRLGLSETILVFKQHLDFLGGVDGFINIIGNFKNRICEKKILVEVETFDEAAKLCKNNIDGIQFDKLPPEQLKLSVQALRNINPHIIILGAGGINENNADAYARTGINAIVTSALYHTKPIDISCRIEPLE